MKEIIHFVVQLMLAGKRAYGRKWSFLVLSLCVFSLGVMTLGKLDLLPDATPVAAVNAGIESANTTPSVSGSVESQAVLSELPVKIEIPTIHLSASIENPTTTDTEVLDQRLLKGAVRYPTSAELGENGNVVLFGHSSYLPIVGNQAYKTFDGIQKLVAGDTITVYSSGTAYIYQVRTMTKESAAGNAGIPLTVSGRTLTLSTCNSFGAKTDRFVVVADLIESHAINSQGT